MCEKEKEDKEQEKQKDIQFYLCTVTAWYSTALEYDKSILTLSAGGIGLLVTLITTKGVSSVSSLIVVIVALLCFMISLISILVIFSRNKKHLEDIVKENKPEDQMLTILDKVSITSFIVAVILSCILGISTAAESLKERDKKMAEEKSQTINQDQNLHESFNGAAKLHPATVDMNKSFNGAANLRPAATPDSSQQSANQEQGGSAGKK